MVTQYIKLMRKTRGYTQKYLAQKLYIAESTFSHYENGKRTIPYETFVRIMEICEYSIKMYDCKNNVQITKDDLNLYLEE